MTHGGNNGITKGHKGRTSSRGGGRRQGVGGVTDKFASLGVNSPDRRAKQAAKQQAGRAVFRPGQLKQVRARA